MLGSVWLFLRSNHVFYVCFKSGSGWRKKSTNPKQAKRGDIPRPFVGHRTPSKAYYCVFSYGCRGFYYITPAGRVRSRGCFLQSLDIFLETLAALYAHFFLLVCPACRNYLESVCSSAQRNVEPADAHIFGLHCYCGWAGELAGFSALRHWVECGAYMDLRNVADCSVVLDRAA